MGVINLGLLVDKIKRKLESSGFIKNTDYASAIKAGVVKVGDGLAITDAGVLSASGGGGFSVDTIYDGDGTTVAFTFPTGKSMADYNFILLCVYYTTGGGGKDCVTEMIPAALVTGELTLTTSLWYNASWNSQYTITATGATKTTGSGSYVINKVYAF